jgi:hypothetical protein
MSHFSSERAADRIMPGLAFEDSEGSSVVRSSIIGSSGSPIEIFIDAFYQFRRENTKLHSHFAVFSPAT